MPDRDVLTVRDVGADAIAGLLDAYGLRFVVVDDGRQIPGSFWGDREAGIVGSDVFARSDTPVHSVLHETCHVVCMDPARRGRLDTDAGGDDLEEAAVCFLQILLADHVPGVGRERLIEDMDRWGYSFRLGSAGRWFRSDADDAREWLLGHGLVSDAGSPVFRLRG